MLKNNSTRHFILLICLVLTACGPATTIKPVPTSSTESQEADAIALMQSGDYNAAAEEYIRLANQHPDTASLYQLKAATAFFQAGKIIEAKQTLDNTVIEADVFPLQALQKSIILAKIALSENDAEQALFFLESIPPGNTPAALLVAYHETRAEVFTQQANTEFAIEQRLLAYSESDLDSEKNINSKELWQDLNTLSTTVLESMRSDYSEKAGSWIELVQISKALRADPAQLKNALSDWQGRFPLHPANRTIIPELISASEQISIKPEIVALLLPMTGKYREASQAVREGFMSAWMNEVDDKPEIRFYNSETSNINQVYLQAIEEGANFIVGPLKKDVVKKLIRSSDIRVRTLALNYLDDDTLQSHKQFAGVTFFQFGLSPEHEAIQVAERAYFDGHLRALVVAPADPWGDRLIEAFSVQFKQLGGMVLETSRFDSLTDNYAEAIRALLNTDISKERASKLTNTLSLKIESETRRRQDVDFIFIAAQHQHTKQIIPQIYFERAREIPVYTTSHINAFFSNPEEYIDMNNILFADIPWILDPDVAYANSKLILERNWPEASTTTHRLYALGYDAYGLLNRYGQLSSSTGSRYEGATGMLEMDNQGRVHRKLTWARFMDGLPQLIDVSVLSH